MPIPNGVSAAEIELLRDGTLAHDKAEVLCRMASYAYFTSEPEIQNALGTNWSGLETWLDEDINNQGFAVWADGVAVVSFRGTDSTSDWKRNSEGLFPDPHPLGGRRHDGFFDVWAQKSEVVRQILETTIPSNCQLWLTGHSLGGVVATATAADFLLSPPARVNAGMAVVTFGQPRYGNEQFQQAYDQRMLERHWFYANDGDPVPHLGPSFWGYRHGGTLQYFNEDGTHLPLTKDQAGLQAAPAGALEEAARRWRQLDERVGRIQTREQLEAIVDDIARDLGNFTVSAPPPGGLQGELPWSVEAHSLEVYWQRIKALT